MIRDDMIEEMISFVNSIPEGASEYHKMDMLLSRMERLGMLAPAVGVGEEDDWGFLDYKYEWEDIK